MPAFSLIEMMIAIVILGLGLVMTATMFPVAWTRARTLTEYTTQRVVSQSAAATITETLRPSGSTFTAYDDPGTGSKTGKYFLSSGSLAGDLIYDPVLHTDPDPSLSLPCAPPAQCYSHLAVLIPSDTRVHALNMQNLSAQSPTGALPAENPFAIERVNQQGSARVDLCDITRTPPECITGYPLGDPSMSCDSPLDRGAQFCARSFYSPQVGIGARLYPPMDNPPADTTAPAFNTWLEKFGSHRYTWAALHRLRRPVGPIDVPRPADGPLAVAESKLFASQAAAAAGTTRTFDFYIVTLKRAQSTSRFALQDPATTPDPIDIQVASVAPLGGDQDMALPVAWRVQIEIPLNLRLAAGPIVTPGTVPPATNDDPTGVPTEVQVPPANFSGSAEMVIGMFPSGTQFVDEVNGQILRVTRRRLNATGTMAFLTLDRELLLEDFDDSATSGGDGQLQTEDVLRTVWVYPPPIAERSTTVLFDDSAPVVGIDVRSISMTPPG